MTRKLLAFCVILLLSLYGRAQNRVVTGTVTSKTDGLPLPGASIVVKGTKTGTQSDAGGTFTLNVSGPNVILVFSSLGFKTIEVPASSNTMRIAFEPDANQLSEVVVTGAFGTTQTSRSSTTNAQVVSSQKLNTIRQTDLNNALAGKVSGIQVRSQSVAALGRETEVRLRGASGFGTGSGALYVVNGTILPNANDLNLDDVESITVLQGPAATAQFGSQAANGAIVITLKKGIKAQGIGVVVNIGAQIDKVAYLPSYQNLYAGGANPELTTYRWKDGDPLEWKALDGKGYADYSDDSSWGPKMEGQEYIPWYAWYPGSKYSYKTSSLLPKPDNSKDFFNTGVTLNNSVSISQATDNLSFKLTYGNQDVQGLIPNSKLKKNMVNVITSYDITRKLNIAADISYVNRALHGDISDDYGNQSTGSFNQWYHRNIDMGIMKELRGLKSPQGQFASWNHGNPDSYDPNNPIGFYGANYWYNFYTYFDQTNTINSRDRLYGNIRLTYKISDDLSIAGTYRKQQYSEWTEEKISTSLETSATQTGQKGYYNTANLFYNRENIEFLATYKKTLGNFSINANGGSDFFNAMYKLNSANTNNGLSVPDLYAISNSVNAPSVINTRREEKYRALFAKASVGYKNLLFVDATVRNDWFSTLPQADNSVLSKSFGASFLFSDLLKNLSWLSSGKLRASWGEIPLALGTTNDTFGAYRYPGGAYTINQFKWNDGLLMTSPDILTDPNISGAVSRQSEIGLDVSFLKNRVGFSATYWQGVDKNFPYTLALNGASGYTGLLTNIGEIKREGFELQLNGRPVDIRNFSWNVSATWSPLIKNDIVELSKEYGITRTASIGGVRRQELPYLIHIEGKRWGRIYGNGIKRHANGQPEVTADGAYVNDPNVDYGSVLPKHTGGFQNTFNIFNNFTVGANLDWQIGGKFVSLSNMWGSFSGLTERTAAMNDRGHNVRDAVANGGGVKVVGENAAGQPVSYYVDAKTYYQGLYNNRIFDEYVYDLTYVKLREISVGYNIPVKKLGMGKYIQNANFSVVARNPVLIYSKTKDFDPSEIDALVGETGQLPGTRGFGFNLRVGF
jgi:TonB-linked SusC/RagA family outer membrane protein